MPPIRFALLFCHSSLFTYKYMEQVAPSLSHVDDELAQSAGGVGNVNKKGAAGKSTVDYLLTHIGQKVLAPAFAALVSSLSLCYLSIILNSYNRQSIRLRYQVRLLAMYYVILIFSNFTPLMVCYFFNLIIITKVFDEMEFIQGIQYPRMRIIIVIIITGVNSAIEEAMMLRYVARRNKQWQKVLSSSLSPPLSLQLTLLR